MRTYTLLISTTFAVFISLSVNGQLVCGNDTIQKKWQHGKLSLELHHCDSGEYVKLLSEKELIYKSGFEDGYLGKTWWLKLTNKSTGIVMADYFCDAGVYTLMVVDSAKKYTFYSLYESFAGDECDLNKTAELIIKDDDKDGYQELYFNYKKETGQLIRLRCSKKVDLKNLIKQ